MRRSLFVSILVFFLLLSFSASAQDNAGAHLQDARSLYEAGHWVEADEAYREAYERAEDGTRQKAAVALDWGTLLWEQGEYESARELVEEAIELARQLELDDATGELLSTLGHIEASMGDLQDAEATLNACISTTAEMGDEIHRALCRLNRRQVRELQGESPGPESEFRTDVETLRNAESALSVGVSLTKTAELYRDNEDFERAEQLLNRAAEIYRDIGSVPSLANNRLRRAQLEYHRGNYERARELVDGLLARFEEMRNRPMMVHTLALQAQDAVHRGNLEEGVGLLRRALSIAEEIDNPQLVARVRLALCELNYGGSPEHCRGAVEVFENTGMTLLEIRARSALARTHQIRKNYEQARDLFRDAIEQLESTVDTTTAPYLLAHTLQYANLCQVNAQLETTGGYTTCREALDGIDELDDEALERHAELRASTVHAAARTAMQAERREDAGRHFREAAELYEELGESNHLTLAADIMLRLGAMQYEMDPDEDGALESFRRGLELTEEMEMEEGSDVARIRVSLKTQLAQVHLHREQWERSVELLEPLSGTAQEVGDDGTAAWAYSGLANCYLKLDRRDDAVEALRSGLTLAESAGDEQLVETFEENLERLEGE